MSPRQVYTPRPATVHTDPAVLIPGWTRGQELRLMFILALAVRLISFNAPFTSMHWIKQLQIAPIAQHFAEKDMNILWPETDYSADSPGYIEIEFQLVTWLTAILWKLFGVHEFLARVVTVGFSMGSLLLFYRLANMLLGKSPAFYGLLFLSFVPSNWYFSRVLMSEPLMLFFSIALIYAFCLWVESDKTKHLVWAAVAGALCFLVKLPTLMLVFPLAYLAWLKFGRRMLGEPRLWLFALATLLPAAGYYWHSHGIGLKYFTVGVGFGGGMWFHAEDFLKPGNWSLMFDRFVRQHLTAVGVLLLPLGILALDAVKGKVRLNLFHVWLGAVLVYFVLISGGNLRQNYYQLHILPPAAALIGIGWTELLATRRFHQSLKLVLVGAFLALSVWGVEPMFQEYEPIRKAATELNGLDHEKQPVILFPAGYGSLFYFHRPGWCGREGFGKPDDAVAPEDTPSPEYIRNRIGRGARWAVYFDVSDQTAQPEIREYLVESHKLVGGLEGQYLLFDLSQGRDGGPYRGGEPTAESAAPDATALSPRGTE